MSDRAPTSPCINVCTLDATDVCHGCYRHIGEIAAWSQLSAREQWAVLARAEHRRREREALPA
jgi:uncharacterized protein